jgi:HD-GYP domain-containing protein (c-di-GMP phosphodiesterase class II)
MADQIDMSEQLEHLNRIGIELSAQRDINRLLEQILLAAKEITAADGGTLYLANEDGRSLRFAIVRTDSLGLAYGGSSGSEIPFPDLPLYGADGSENHNMVVAHVALTGQSINIADAYDAPGYDFSGTRAFDANTGYRSQSFLTVPMKNHEGELIGVLQLLNAIDPVSGEICSFSPAAERLVNSLASQAAVALTNRQLIQQLSDLFESFINLINVAIDEKSPHTSGHCQRVPEITMLIADALHSSEHPNWSDFRLDERERNELRIASLLHDCGKITTPAHVVDKSTRLETVFDRIELINTRFELIRRDLELEYLRRSLEQGNSPAADRQHQAQLKQLDQDLQFLQRINRGETYVTEDDLSNLQTIRERYSYRSGDRDLPCLSDNEMENLSIRGGTLTAAEREIMNQHINTTIKMLEALPWPRQLSRVPEFAGGHHERMDGKGYPRGLTREQMSIPARVLGIADIFEALTAADRPYKKPNTVSQALSILANFADNGHIDPDIFDIFVAERVWEDYAIRFLTPEQRDEVDIAALFARKTA